MYSFFWYELPLAQRLRQIREAGFDFTALWRGEEEPDIRAGRKHELPRLARDLGLAVDNIHVPFEQCNRLLSPEIDPVYQLSVFHHCVGDEEPV